MSIEHTYSCGDDSTARKTEPSVREGIGTVFAVLWLLFVVAVAEIADVTRRNSE